MHIQFSVLSSPPDLNTDCPQSLICCPILCFASICHIDFLFGCAINCHQFLGRSRLLIQIFVQPSQTFVSSSLILPFFIPRLFLIPFIYLRYIFFLFRASPLSLTLFHYASRIDFQEAC